MNRLYLNPYLFFIILNGKLIAWDYKYHQQFEFSEQYIHRLLEISQNPTSHNKLDIELLNEKLILTEEDKDDWGWDCLSKIFHFGTQIKQKDLEDINTQEPSSFSSEYIEFCEDIYFTSPPILIEKKGETIKLPPPDLSLLTENNFLSVLAKRKTCRTFHNEAIPLNIVSILLYATFGNFHLQQTEFQSLGLEKIGLRKTSPAGGGLHSSEAYLIVQNIDGLEKGIYHYQAHKHVLSLIKSADIAKNLKEIFCGQYFIENISLGIFITSRFEKLWHKYPHSRAYRIALLDAGHLSQTFQLVATALDLNPWLSGAFIDDEVTKILMLDNISEQPLFFVGAGIGPWSSLDPMTRKLALEATK